ncbi:MAG: hypothetical protein K2X77_20755 [Candidatus Obscuribacterales bacterium]|jgi:amino acid transporter|nr:hypothetical protein [Candidatus Obscuribacterales bacterium]
MSEAKMLLFSSISMFAVSLITAFILYVMNVGPVWVMFGGTLAGIAVFIAMCIRSAKMTEE